ncbi:hypothetical protein V4R08_12185 [Nitrobacter sp. NHB1]
MAIRSDDLLLPSGIDRTADACPCGGSAVRFMSGESVGRTFGWANF